MRGAEIGPRRVIVVQRFGVDDVSAERRQVQQDLIQLGDDSEQAVFQPLFRWAFLTFPAAGRCLPWLDCFRYCLPNFPHSPAIQGRERHRFHAFLANGAQTEL